VSEWGTIADKLIALSETAVADLTAERGIRQKTDLSPDDYPHLFVYDPEEATAPLPFQQVSVVTTFHLLLLTDGETQEAIALKGDSIRDEIRGDRTLTGSVLFSYVTSRSLAENPADRIKAIDLFVTTTVEA
jgi:hypothetical protein